MKFLIRDDDTCAFTSKEELINCYGHIWDRIPVNLSVTPYRIPGNDKSVPAQYRNCDRTLPLQENSMLTEFLRDLLKQKRICIALHGYNHKKSGNQPEFVGGSNLNEKTQEGKRYLENLLDCKVNTFVPPNNGIGKEGLQSLIANNLNLIGTPSLIRKKYRLVTVETIMKYFQVKFFKTIHGSHYPYILNVNGHKEVSYCSVTPAQDMKNILNYFEICRKFNGVFIFSTHYHAFERQLKSGEYIKDVLEVILDKARSTDNIQFCTYDHLWIQP